MTPTGHGTGPFGLTDLSGFYLTFRARALDLSRKVEIDYAGRTTKTPIVRAATKTRVVCSVSVVAIQPKIGAVQVREFRAILPEVPMRTMKRSLWVVLMRHAGSVKPRLLHVLREQYAQVVPNVSVLSCLRDLASLKGYADFAADLDSAIKGG
jgi:hypothetical protein